MHKIAMEMGKWAMEKAKAHGFDNLNSQDWDDLKDCIETVKEAICADKEYREVEAMDEEEKIYGRAGYRGRDPRTGQFIHQSGRGRSAGYTPYLHMMDDENYNAYNGMYDDTPFPMTGYRMGYTDGRWNNYAGHDGYMPRMDHGSSDWNRRSGYYDMEMRHPSRYGETYDRYRDHRKHYTETKDAESKKKMEESTREYVSDFESNLKEMYRDADPQLKQQLKGDLTKMLQQL